MGAPVVDSDGSEEDQDRPDGVVQQGGVVDDAVERLIDDPGAGEGHEDGFAKRGEVFDLAVTVGMVFVGGLVTDLNRKEGQRNADEVERGVGGVGEHAE